MAKRQSLENFSVFGQIEEAAANHMLTKYPKEVSKIPLEMFPSRAHHPDVWKNSSGVEASFAIRLPWTLKAEFEETIANLRA